MSTIRKISKVWQSKPTLEGVGVHLHRAFGYYQVPQPGCHAAIGGPA